MNKQGRAQADTTHIEQSDQHVGTQFIAARDQHFHGDAPAPPESPESTAKARRDYLRELARCCRLLPLSDIGHDHGLTRSISLDQVYIELQTLTPEEHAGEQSSDRGMSAREKFLSARDVAARDDMFVLLGDPGSGKSSFVKELAAAIADAQLDGGDAVPGFSDSLLPVLIELRNLVGPLTRLELAGLDNIARQQTLAAAVRDHAMADLARFDSQTFAPGLRGALESQACLLILDGLDEVPEVHRPLIRETVAAVVARYRPPRVIVTCRTRSYQGAAAFPDLPAHTLAPLEEDQIQSFCKAWYHAQGQFGNLDAADNAEALGNNLAAAATSDAKLQELAANPMLLTSMAIVHQQNRQLPRKRAEVYDRAIQVLLTKWPSAKRRGGETISRQLDELLARETKLVRAMRRLAFVAHESNEGQTDERREASDLPRKAAVHELEQEFRNLALAGEFLDYVDQRAGLLIGRGGGGAGIPATYAFAHRTFQEFLAGCELVIRLRTKGIRAKLKGGDYWYLAAQFGIEHCLFNEPSGDIFVEDLPELLCPSSTPRSQAAWRGHLLAAHQIVHEGVDRAQETLLRRLRKRLAGIIEQERLPSPVERAEAGRLLARIGDHRFDEKHGYLPKGDRLGFVEIPAGTCHDDKGRYAVDRFFIGKWPVTNAQFHQFVLDDGYRNPAWWQAAIAADRWDEHGFKAEWPEETVFEPWRPAEPYGLPNHPAVSISWYEAMAYCAWLGDKLRNAPATPAALRELLDEGGEIRLPTFAEGLRAARGDGEQEYPWGDRITPNHANYSDTGIHSTSVVGCFPAGRSLTFSDVEELSGNVWEWCMGAEGQGRRYRVIRGGGWFPRAGYCRCAARCRNEPGGRALSLGFRLVLAPSSTRDPDHSP